jgi:DNA adenine methylase
MFSEYTQSELDTGTFSARGAPLFKWPGGKRLLLQYLLSLLPPTIGRYYEPFIGGGALFFALQPRCAILSDKNSELINCYEQVRDRAEDVIAQLSLYKNSKEDYYRIRANVPEEPVARAARFLYLMALSFNGIHRVNLDGEFNVPYNNRSIVQISDPNKIRNASKALSTTKLICEDFEKVVADAQKGDVVYLDPPYTVAHNNNGFRQYNAKVFSWQDQERLATTARDLASRGCYVLISNADHASILDLYKDFRRLHVQRNSLIAAKPASRRTVTEYIFYNEV